MSILKPQKPRQPLQTVNLGHNNDEDDTTEVRQRRVSFAGVNKIKEFNSEAESLVICDTPAYEEEFTTSSDSSQIIKNINSPNSSLISASNNIKETIIGECNMDLSCTVKGVPVSESIRPRYSYVDQGVVMNGHSGIYIHNEPDAFHENPNNSQDSMDITGITSPKDDYSVISTHHEVHESNMDFCHSTMLIHNILPETPKNGLFYHSHKVISNDDIGNLSDMDISMVNSDKENMPNPRSGCKTVLKDGKSLSSNNTLSMPDKHVFNISSMLITQSAPILPEESDQNTVLPPVLRGFLGDERSKPLSNQSPAHKRYRLSELSDNQMDMTLLASERPYQNVSVATDRPCSLSNYGSGERINLGGDIYSNIHPPEFNKHLSSSVSLRNESVHANSPGVPQVAMANRSLILPNYSLNGNKGQGMSDKLEQSIYPSGKSNFDSVDISITEVVTNCPQLFGESKSLINDKETHSSDDSSGESMNIFYITERKKSESKTAQETIIGSNPKTIENTISRAPQFCETLDGKASAMNITNNESCGIVRRPSLMVPRGTSFMDLTKVQNKDLKDNDGDTNIGSCLINNSYRGVLHESIASGPTAPYNTSRNDSKRKLEELKDETTRPGGISESRVDKVYCAGNYLTMCYQDDSIGEVDCISEENNHIINPTEKLEVAQANCMRNSYNNIDIALMSNTEQPKSPETVVNKTGHLEMEDAPQNHIIKFSKLPLEIIPNLITTNDTLPNDVQKEVNASNNLGDSIHSGIVNVEELSRDPRVISLSAHIHEVIPLVGVKDIPEKDSDNETIPFFPAINGLTCSEQQKAEPDAQNIINHGSFSSDNIEFNATTSCVNALQPKLTCQNENVLHLAKEDYNVPLDDVRTDTSTDLGEQNCDFVDHANASDDTKSVDTSNNLSYLMNSLIIPHNEEASLALAVCKPAVIPVYDVPRKNPLNTETNKEFFVCASCGATSNQLIEKRNVAYQRKDLGESILSDVKVPGQIFSPLQLHNKHFMEDLGYHFYDWTEWTKRFFNNSIILLIKVPWGQFTYKTPVLEPTLEVSIKVSDKVKDKALKFCSTEIVSRINEMKLLNEFKYVSDSEKVFSRISKESQRITPFYQSVLDLVLYYPAEINDSSLGFSIVDLKSRSAFTTMIQIKNWNSLTENDITVTIKCGKVSLEQVRNIFSSIPPCKERFYEFVCALESLVHK